MYKKVVHTSDIVLCDGKTIKSEMLTDSPGHSDTHKFPTQRPSPADLILWKMALRMISSDFLVLTGPLQEYVCYPHNLPQWMINDDGSILHNNIKSTGDKEYHEVYIPTSKPLACKTQSGQRFNSTIVVMGGSGLQNYASVTRSQPGHIVVHSSIPRFIPPPPVSGFKHAIKTFANQSLLTSLDYDGDGSWILGGMLLQSLVIIHDGSYMKEFTPDICSAATMIYCMNARARCKCTWAEKSTSAGPNRGEILGGVMTQLILHAASSKYHGKIPLVRVDCDNNGVVSHGNAPLRALPTNQSQADILCTFKCLVSIQSSRSSLSTSNHMPTTQKDGKIVH